MYNTNNNSSIHQTSTCMPAPARTHKSPPEELMNCGISNQHEPTCWDCRFFDTAPRLNRDQPPEEECQQGECRRHPPVTDHHNRDASVNYAVFPIVIACDWCGEFRPRAARVGHGHEDEANAAFDLASHEDATDAGMAARAGACEPLPERSPSGGV